MIRRAFDDPDLDPELADAFGFDLESEEGDDSDDDIEDAERLALLAALERCGLIGPPEDADDRE